MGAVFEGYDHVVTPSGSCAAMVRENYPRIARKAAAEGRGTELGGIAGSLVPRVYELSEFLVDVLGVTDVGAYFRTPSPITPPVTVCARWGSGSGRAGSWRPSRVWSCANCPARGVLRLRRHLRLKNPAVSAAMGTDKADSALTTGAEVLCGADSSCLMHLGGILRRRGDPLRPLHLAEILASTEAEPHP